MKNLVLIISALTAGSLLGAAEAPKSSYSITVDFPYTSKYVFRGVELAKQSIQPSVEVTVGDFYAGVWTNQPVIKNIDNEFDFYAGYKYKLNDQWNVDLGLTNYYYPELNASTGGKRSTTEAYVGINGDFKGVTPGFYIYRDLTLNVTTMQVQAGYSLALAEAGMSLDLSAQLGRVFSNSSPDYTYWSVNANIPYKLNDKTTVYAGVTYTTNNLKFTPGDFTTFNCGVSIGF